jgi:hypothetical protein
MVEYQNYTEAQNEELIEEIYSRQQHGFYEGTLRIVRITCRCCPGSVFVYWYDWCYYRPRQALPCLMCGRLPILTIHSRHGEEGEHETDCWIHCERCHMKEYIARRYLKEEGFRRIEYTALQLIGRWNAMLRHKTIPPGRWLC